MRMQRNYKLPAEKKKLLNKSIRLEWLTIFFMLTIVLVLYLALGSSQAMKTAWIEDMLALTPPIAFLVAMHFRNRPASEKYPYGHARVMLLAFMTAAVAVLVVGVFLLFGSIVALVKMEHPTLNHFDLFGWHVWSGWVMIVALIYSVIPPYILSRIKLRYADQVHEKTLHADAAMNKADWTTGLAAILGILGIGLGWWWADAVAAAFISLNVIWDGGRNARTAMADLMDRRPTNCAGDKPLGLETRILAELCSQPGVEGADVRLREQGHVISGEIFVALEGEETIASKVDELSEKALALDWRLRDLTVMPVKREEL